VAVDTHRFRVTLRAATGREPFDVALLRDGRVFARDWKSGDLLLGQIERQPRGLSWFWNWSGQQRQGSL
jgi:hypothetical protein